jgi:hypothetical protein
MLTFAVLSVLGHAAARAPPAAQKAVATTFRDVLLQAVSEVGDSQEVGKDGQGGLLGFLVRDDPAMAPPPDRLRTHHSAASDVAQFAQRPERKPPPIA